MWKLWRPELKGGIHVCGCGHSGTSILVRLLGAHSNIYALPGETGIAKKESYTTYRNNVYRFEQEAIQNNACIWAEKTPKHVRNIRFILNCAPTTKIILITRNPHDTIASLKRRYGSLRKSIRRWKYDNAKVLHWSNHPQCVRLKYECLILNTAQTMEALMAFLGQAFEPKQLDFYAEKVDWYQSGHQPLPGPESASLNNLANPGPSDGLPNSETAVLQDLDESQYGREIPHNAYRNHQINQPLFNNIGSYRKYLTNEEVSIIHRSCGRLAGALGYDVVSPSC